MADADAAEDTDTRSGVADTEGWDLVSAITLREMNQSIANNASYPKKFSQAFPDDPSITVSGNFSNWEMTTGGQGSLIHMQLSITDGVFAEGEGASKPFSGYIIFELKARFVEEATGAKRWNAVPNTDHPVAIVGKDFDGLSGFTAAGVADLLGRWVADHLVDFKHIFATVDYAKIISEKGIPWMAPSDEGYAVAAPREGATLDNSVFAVMCMVQGRKASGQIADQVSVNAVPKGCAAGLLISRDRFIQNICLPMLPTLFPSATGETVGEFFDLTAGGTRIENKIAVDMNDKIFEGHGDVTPRLEEGKFTIDLSDTELKLAAMSMSFDVPLLGIIHEAMTCHITYNARYGLTLSEDKRFLELLILHEDCASEITSSKAFRITKIVITAVTIVISVLAAGVAGVAKIVSGGAEALAVGAEATEITQLVSTSTTTLAEAEMAPSIATAIGTTIRGGLLSVQELGVEFASLWKMMLTGAGAIGLVGLIPSLQESIADEDFANLPRITNLIDEGFAKIIEFPGVVGDMKLESAALNGSLQFGLVRA